MCRRVIDRSRLAFIDINLSINRLANTHFTLDQAPEVKIDSALFLAVVDGKTPTRSNQLSGVARLPARLGIKGRAIEHQYGLITRLHRFKRRTFAKQAANLRTVIQALVADKGSFTLNIELGCVIDTKATGRARARVFCSSMQRS